MNEGSHGRRVLLAVGVAAVALAGLVGSFVGANGAAVHSSIRAFGLVALPTTPATLAALAMTLAAVVVGTLFGLVELASRLEDAE